MYIYIYAGHAREPAYHLEERETERKKNRSQFDALLPAHKGDVIIFTTNI